MKSLNDKAKYQSLSCFSTQPKVRCPFSHGTANNLKHFGEMNTACDCAPKSKGGFVILQPWGDQVEFRPRAIGPQKVRQRFDEPVPRNQTAAPACRYYCIPHLTRGGSDHKGIFRHLFE